MIVFSVGFASASLGGEIEKGTMELLLSQPVTRRSVVLERYLFFLLALAALVIATLIPVVLGAPIAGGHVSIAGVAALSLQAFLFFAAVGSYSVFFAAISSTRSRAIFASVAVAIVSYALDVLAKLNNFVSNFHFLSLFYYYDPFRYLHSASYAWGDLTVLTAISVFSLTAAVLWFNHRDIAC